MSTRLSQPDHGHFEHEPRPEQVFGPAERAFHIAAVPRFREPNREEMLHYEAVS